MCVRLCVCPACPRPSRGAACGAGVCGCCRRWGVPPPPPPLWFFLGGALLCRSPVVPVLVLVVSVPPPLLFRAALFAVCVFCFFRTVCVCLFWVSLLPMGRFPRLGVARFGWVVLLRLWVDLSSVLSGWGVWPPLVVLVGGMVAVGCSRPPPVFFLFFGGVCLFLPLPSLGWRTHWSAFCVVFFCQAFPGPMVRLGYVHVGLGAPSCRVRFWLCRVGGCARRLRVALG